MIGAHAPMPIGGATRVAPPVDGATVFGALTSFKLCLNPNKLQ